MTDPANERPALAAGRYDYSVFQTKPDFARARFEKSGQRAQKRCLARAVATRDHKRFTGGDTTVQLVLHAPPAAHQQQIFDLNFF
jgi:hypothetical protein